MEFLTCVSIIAESRVIDKVYLISWSQKVLWNCYFLRKLLFQSLYFLRTPIFSKQLYFFARTTFSIDAVYWNSYFPTANLVFTVTLFIYYLVINPVVFKFKIPGDAQITWAKILHKIYFLRVVPKRTIHRKI